VGDHLRSGGGGVTRRYAARAVFVFGVSALLLSALMFAPVPKLDVSSDERAGGSGASTAEVTPTSVELSTYDGYMTQDAEAVVPALIGVGAIALSSGYIGSKISDYMDQDSTPDSQSSAYYTAQSFGDRLETDHNSIKDGYEATRTMAYRVAETSFAEAMANGSDKVDAQLAADEAVSDYLGDVINDEFVRRNNAYVTSAAYINNQSGTDLSIGTSSPNPCCISNSTWEIWSNSAFNRSYNVTEHNGGNSWLPVSSQAGTSISVTFTSGDYSDLSFSSYQSEFSNQAQKYVDLRSEVVTEIGNFTSSVNKSQYENLSADEIVSPVNQALDWGQSYNDTGSTGYASALASSLGYAVNGTGTMYHVKMPASSSTWYNGTVYADEATIPNATITTGKVYNGSSTTAYVATSSGTTTLDEDWKVVEITTRTGESLNATALSTWSTTTLNASAPLETLRKWQELKEEAEESSGGGGLGAGLAGGVGIIALLGGAFLAMRDGDDKGGGGTVILGGGGRGRN
jgi:hypothetical protein